MAGYDSLGVANNFYNALNAANQRALGNLQSLRAENDWNPVPSFLNTINARLRLANAIQAGRERQDYYNQLQAGLNGRGQNNTPSQLGGTMQGVVGQGIGVDEGGYYNTPAGGSIYGIDTSGWGVPSGESVGVKDMQPPQQQPNKFNFNDADYIPTAQNGYHLGDYPQTEEYGDPTDYQRQMAANAIGYNLGSLEPRQQTWFPKTPQSAPKDSFGKAFQAAENAVGENMQEPAQSMMPKQQTMKIQNNQVMGTVTPEMKNTLMSQKASPNQSPLMQRRAQQMIDQRNSLLNPNLPSFENPQVQAMEGQQTSPQMSPQEFDEKMNLRRWLEWDAQHNGVTNPLVALDRYKMFMQPMREQAEADELRNAYYTLNNPNASDQQKMNAISLIEYNKKNPYLGEDHDMKMDKYMYDMGYIPENGFGGYDGDSGEYGGDDVNARAIYSHLASQGLPANVIAGIMGNLQAESNFNSSAVGDGGNSIGLAQWYAGRGNNLRNFAQQRGKEWNDVGTQLDFLLDEIKQSNPDLLKRMANLSPHDAAILFHDEFEKSADTPEMKARRGQYATDIYGGRRQGSGNKRYRRNPYAMTPMQKMQMQHQMRMEEIAARNAYRNGNRVGRDGSLGGFDSTGKTGVGLRQSAMNLAQLQNVSADDAKGQENYNKEINNFAKNIASAYRLGNSSLDSNTLGLAVYKELNKTKSGLRPEPLARAAATAVYLSRGDVDAGDLQKLILQHVYNEGQQQQGTPSGSVNSTDGNNPSIIQAPIDRDTVVDEESAARAQNNSFLDKVGYALDRVGNAIKVDKYNDKPIGANKFGDDWDNMWDSIAERNKQESKKRKEEYEEKKRKEKAKRDYLEATR